MNKGDAKVTISEVARRSNVSKTTVSRYINGRFEMMSEETRKRIESVIDELGFRPSRVAQNLKSRHTRIIGCIIADITSSFSTHLVKGINDICEENEYQVLFVNTNNDPVKEVNAIKSLIDSQVDGLIVNTTGYNDEFLVSVRQNGMPIVMADRYLEQEGLIDIISSTNYRSTYECIEFLSHQGYDCAYFFGQELGINKNRVIRHQAFLDANKKFFGNEGSAYTVLVTEKNRKYLMSVLQEIKENHKDKNIALFAVNGMMMMDLVVALKELGYKIGTDFGLCGFDDWQWAKLIEPGITAIRQDTYKTGVETAKRLLHLIYEEPNAKPVLIELPTKLMQRGSTNISK